MPHVPKTRRIEELTAQLANIGQTLGEARINQQRSFEIILFKNVAVPVEALENQRQGKRHT